jgi:hypothetical protein
MKTIQNFRREQMGYTEWHLGAKRESPVDFAAADCTTIDPKDFTIMTIMGPLFRNGQVLEFFVDPSPVPQPSRFQEGDSSCAGSPRGAGAAPLGHPTGTEEEL